MLTYLQGMEANEKFGLEKPEHPKKIIIDYGGPNVAKPLHVGHLRSAVIGESVKRISRYVGHEVIGDVHLGDWGLQMGLVITGLQERQPELVYFDENYTGEYPEEAPFTISELEEIYPAAQRQVQGRSRVQGKGHGSNLQITERCQRISCSVEAHYQCVCERPEEELFQIKCRIRSVEG